MAEWQPWQFRILRHRGKMKLLPPQNLNEETSFDIPLQEMKHVYLFWSIFFISFQNIILDKHDCLLRTSELVLILIGTGFPNKR